MSVIAPIKPYFKIAMELKEHVPVIAYYAKLYAVQKGLELIKDPTAGDTSAAKTYIIGELQSLEEMKKAIGDVPPEDMKYTVDNFVMSIFAKTDKDERTCETITKKNAIEFNRCVHFIQLLTNFGELDPEWVEREKYCKYKAGSILKALKSGE